jgi:hypothetical protein
MSNVIERNRWQTVVRVRLLGNRTNRKVARSLSEHLRRWGGFEPSTDLEKRTSEDSDAEDSPDVTTIVSNQHRSSGHRRVATSFEANHDSGSLPIPDDR